ncbi:MAG: hypothetical protein H0U79_09090 [Solirubrobacterales bacterium]|nr:hypothetical protein [Solirubrobacterales bacterium]
MQRGSVAAGLRFAAHGANERARRLEQRLHWPMVAVALLAVPSVSPQRL